MKNKDYTIETLLFCLLLAILGSMVSCTKEEITEPTKKVFRVSQRYTNPPDLDVKGNWIPYTIVTKEIIGVDYEAYQNAKPDTVISSCSIDKIDSSFKIEIRKFIIQ